jgi:dUTP pyrophosphatase
MTAVLSGRDILSLINAEPPLIEDYTSLEEQLQPNGFDITVRDIALLQNPGQIAADNSRRIISELAPLAFDGLGFIDLVPGVYSITYNEIVHLPNNLMALARPRSSLLRCGVTVGTAVWDAGYSGRSQSMLVVYHPQGFRLQKNARVTQLVFMKVTGETDGYNGAYQRENMD